MAACTSKSTTVQAALSIGAVDDEIYEESLVVKSANAKGVWHKRPVDYEKFSWSIRREGVS